MSKNVLEKSLLNLETRVSSVPPLPGQSLYARAIGGRAASDSGARASDTAVGPADLLTAVSSLNRPRSSPASSRRAADPDSGTSKAAPPTGRSSSESQKYLPSVTSRFTRMTCASPLLSESTMPPPTPIQESGRELRDASLPYKPRGISKARPVGAIAVSPARTSARQQVVRS